MEEENNQQQQLPYQQPSYQQSRYPYPPQQPSKELGVSSGFKFVIGGCLALVVIGAVIVVGLGLLGAIPLALVGSKPSNQTTTPSQPFSPPPSVEAGKSGQNKSSEENWAAKFAALSEEEKLRKRLAGVEGANKNMTNGCVASLTGPNQDIITIKAPLQGYSKENARTFATAFLDGFLDSEQTVKEMIALDVVSVVLTDGKRSWTRDLKTGDLIEKETQ